MANDDKRSSVIPPADGPRGKALRHMRKLVQAAAFGGAAAFGLAACPPIVCDPLPPPLECDQPGDLGRYLKITAHWEAGDGGAAQVRVEVRFDEITEGRVQVSGTPQLIDATLVGVPATTPVYAFIFAPNAGATSVTATVAGTCAGAAKTERLRFDLSGGLDAGAAVPVTLLGP